MKKLLHISANQYPPLNQPHHTKKIWIELAKAFDEYHILARSNDGRFHHYIEGKIHLHLVPKLGGRSRSFYISGLYLFRIIPKFKITHLLAQSAILGGLYAIWAGKIFKLPTMVEIHGEEYFSILAQKNYSHIFLAKMIRYVFGNAQKIRSLNPLMTKKLLEFQIDKNIVEIPNRVDLTVFDTRKTDFCIGKKAKLISVGRFVEAKNYTRLIRSLGHFDLDFHLSIIGGGPLKKQYQAEIKKYDLEEKIELIDWVEQTQLAKRIMDADIYMQYSQSEGMPRTILEAMALQMPIVTTAAGSIGGIIEHKNNGIILPLNDEKALLSSLINLINNDSLREQIAKKAYRDVLNKYEWNEVFDLYRAELSSMTYENS